MILKPFSIVLIWGSRLISSCLFITDFMFGMQFPADLVTFTEEIFNEKLHFLRSVTSNVGSEKEILFGSIHPFGNSVEQYAKHF